MKNGDLQNRETSNGKLSLLIAVVLFLVVGQTGAQSNPQKNANDDYSQALRILNEPLEPSNGPDTSLIDLGFKGTYFGEANRASPSEQRELARQAKVILDAIARTPGVKTPKDLYPRMYAVIGGSNERQSFGAWVGFQTYSPTWIVRSNDGKIKLAPGAEAMFTIFNVNPTPTLQGASELIWKDASGSFGLEPAPFASVPGVEVFNFISHTVMLLPEGVALFDNKVSLERVLRAHLAELEIFTASTERGIKEAKDELAAFQLPQAVENRRLKGEEKYQAALGKGASERELVKLARSLGLEEAHSLSQIETRLRPNSMQQPYLTARETLLSQLASSDASTRAAPACVRSHARLGDKALAQFALQGERDCIPVVQFNPDLERKRTGDRARALWMSVSLRHCIDTIARYSRAEKIIKNHPDELACRKQIDLIREIDWPALRKTLFAR